MLRWERQGPGTQHMGTGGRLQREPPGRKKVSGCQDKPKGMQNAGQTPSKLLTNPPPQPPAPSCPVLTAPAWGLELGWQG